MPDNIATAIADAVRGLDEAETHLLESAKLERQFTEDFEAMRERLKNVRRQFSQAFREYKDAKRYLEQLEREPGTPDSETLSAGERNPSLAGRR